MAVNKKHRQSLETEQKALEINLDDSIYGTFAEIGAGQEVARYFFQVGAAAGTIAKTMSAYDKVYSDEIYGSEPNGRYVCESRLYKMLDHEFELMEARLKHERPKTNFFAFADTIASINFTKTIKGEGWLGLRFQLKPGQKTNDLVIHVKMLDNDNRLQQQAIGVLGVNLIYGVYRYYNDVEILLQSLMDSLHGRISIDMVRLSGSDFDHIDNRLLSRNVHGSEFLYKKNVLVVRGSFRPLTLVNEDMIYASWEQFRNEKDIDAKKSFLFTEITLDNLLLEGDLDEQDFLDRADLLCALGQTVMITNCEQHQKLIRYFSDFKTPKLGMVVGVKQLLDTINEKYYNNLDGRLLTAFGELFTRNVTVYAYPILQEGTNEMMTAENMPVPDEVKFLYKYLLDSKQIIDIQGFHPENLHIYSKQVLRMIQHDEEGWDTMVPEKVAKLVREKCLFGFPAQSLVFQY
jgi:hypothetical protein